MHLKMLFRRGLSCSPVAGQDLNSREEQQWKVEVPSAFGVWPNALTTDLLLPPPDSPFPGNSRAACFLGVGEVYREKTVGGFWGRLWTAQEVKRG